MNHHIPELIHKKSFLKLLVIQKYLLLRPYATKVVGDSVVCQMNPRIDMYARWGSRRHELRTKMTKNTLADYSYAPGSAVSSFLESSGMGDQLQLHLDQALRKTLSSTKMDIASSWTAK